MRVYLPILTDHRTLPDLFRRLCDDLTNAFRRVVSNQEAIPYLLLQSEDGQVWKLTLKANGTLFTERVPSGMPLGLTPTPMPAQPP